MKTARNRPVLIAALVFYSCIVVFAQQPERGNLTVPCRPDKCKVLELWNRIPKLEEAQANRLDALQASLIADPPGLVRSLDREQTLKDLISSSEELTSIYREALKIELK